MFLFTFAYSISGAWHKDDASVNRESVESRTIYNTDLYRPQHPILAQAFPPRAG